MSKTRASFFITGSKHLETIKALGLREPVMKHSPCFLTYYMKHTLSLSLSLSLSCLFIYLFILLRLGVTYIYIKKNIDDNYKTRQGHHNSKNQLLWAVAWGAPPPPKKWVNTKE